MPNIAMTFGFLDATGHPTNWTAANQSVIAGLGLSNLDFGNPQQITGQRINVNAPDQCASWSGVFDNVNAAFAIFSDAAGTIAVGRDAAPCIGTLIAANAVTLYLKTNPVPVGIGPAIAAAAVAPGIAVLANAPQITTYLLTQTHIRVYIHDSQSQGHQTTTCLIMRRLIALGYISQVGAVKTFEVIYVNANGNADTIRGLLPELQITVTGQNINPGIYQNAALGNCLFTFTTVAAGIPAQQYQFGISGGVDSLDRSPKEICNVIYFLMLQPFQWPARNYLYGQQGTVDLGKQPLLGGLRFLGTTCYWSDTTAYPWVVVSQELGQMPAQAQTAVTSIQTRCIGSDNYHVLPVYGLAKDEEKPVLSNWPTVTQISAFANLVLAVLAGQENAPLNRPTVIMALDKYDVGWDTAFLNLLPQPYRARITFYLNGTNWNDNLITNLQTTQILIVNLPRILPAPVFNYFYLNSSLPPIFEGKGTMPIMLNSGSPYLQLSKQQDGFETITAAAPLPPVPTPTTLKVFLYPWVPYVYSPGVLPRSERTHGEGNQNIQTCFNAGNAVVRNTQPLVMINAAAFPGVSETDFPTIQAYLSGNFYIDGNGRIQNKFKALLNADNFEDPFPTQIITKLQMYNAMQTACGAGPANVCAIYRNKIALLTAFFTDAITAPATPLQNYFASLGAYFNDDANDKFLKGMGFAVSAIAQNL